MYEKSEEHKHNKFKLLGGKALAYVILAFFLFVFVLLFFSADTSSHIYFTSLVYILILVL